MEAPVGSTSIVSVGVGLPADLLVDKKARAAAKKARKEARRAQRRKDAEASAATAAKLGLSPTAVNVAAAVSVANRALPEIPPNLVPGAVTICLMYQYKEPAWTSKQHKAALNTITALAGKHSITGRGRCAPEGLNCTLTGSAQGMRAFCYALREWDPMFNQTDFKLEDGIEASARFRTFTLRKVDELVGYGLDGIKAPSLSHHGGKHLEAHEYHEQMQKKDTVIIDVRNAYESAIGHFQPPEGGATLLDPQMRNSTDFPKWLNMETTREQLKDKTVMMYCTGGIRCERATALLNQMTNAEDDGGFKTKDVVMVRGGIERYLKTFPEGGYWKGQNYLFDKRMEQAPEKKTKKALEQDVESYCCLCKTPCAQYRGQHKCSREIPFGGGSSGVGGPHNNNMMVPCNVPVIVCSKCQTTATNSPNMLACPLCVKGYQTPSTTPDLVGQKRKLGIIADDGIDLVTGKQVVKRNNNKEQQQQPSRRLFVGRLPLTITASRLRDALVVASGIDNAKVTNLRWIVDHETHAFYGSTFCEMETLQQAENVVLFTTANGGLDLDLDQDVNIRAGGAATASSRRNKKKKAKKIRRRRARVAFAPIQEGQVWPPPVDDDNSHCYYYLETEYPPIGNWGKVRNE